MKTLLSILLIWILSVTLLQAQVAINKSGDDPDNSAMLDVSSTNSGLLAPRMIEAQRLAITDPATSLIVYQTDGATGFYVNSGIPTSPVWHRIDPAIAGLWDFNVGTNTIFGADFNHKVGLGTNNAARQLHLTGSIELPVTDHINNYGVIYKNGERFIHDFKAENTFGNNTFIGSMAGNFSMSPSISDNFQCSRNTGIGNASLQNLTSGYSNTAVGYRTLYENEAGKYNIAIGNQAMEKNESGGYNVAIGNFALYNNVIHDKNTAVGYGAMSENVGSHNTAVGNAALAFLTLGNYNTVLGSEAAPGDPGGGDDFNRNVIIGYRAGYSLNLNGDNNILIGYMAGNNISTGANNLIIGYDLNAPVADGDNQMYIGGLIYGDLEEMQLSLGNTDPDESAVLDIESDSRGVLIPRLTETQRNSITNPATGLMIYQTNATDGLYLNKGTPATPDWTELGGTTSSYWSYSGANQTIYMNNSTDKVGLGTTNASQQLHLTGSIEMPVTDHINNYGVIYKNGERFMHDFKADNTTGKNLFVGSMAGNFTMTYSSSTSNCSYNTGLGAASLQNLTNGSSNTAIGYGAMLANTEGEDNTAVGKMVMYDNESGSYNVAIGNQALAKNISEDRNIAIGYGTMYENKGSNNTAVGHNALFSNIMGGYNTVLGSEAAVGDPGGGVSFYRNVAIGYRAGYVLDAGANNNILIGYQAGDNITSGTDNLIIGYDLNAPVASGDNQMYIGGLLYGDLDEMQLSVGNTDPDESAILDLDSDSRGLLIPRLTETQRNSISNPATGLMIYQTNATDGLYLNKGTPATPDWTELGGTTSSYWSYSGANQTIYMNNSTDKVGLGTTNASRQLHLTGSIELSETTASNTEGIIYKNGKRFMHNFKPNSSKGKNTFFGIGTGNFSMTFAGGFSSSSNTGIGDSCLHNLTTGYFNTAVGANALIENENGFSNTAAGAKALSSNTSGDGNAAFGAYTLIDSESGNYNTALGGYALEYSTESYNTAVGNGALKYLTSGSDNTAIGYGAGIGTATGFSVNSNVLVGKSAGRQIKTGGDNNILIGSHAGQNITTGSDNIIIGHTLSAPSATGDDQLYIGELIYGDLSGKEVGIGTTNPSGVLHVRKASGTCTTELESSNGRPILKMDAHSTTLNSEIQFEKNGTYMGAIGYNNSTNNIFFYEDFSMVYKDGHLGIRHTTPTYALQLLNDATNGVALAYAWNIYSDKRIKSNIETMDYGLEEILLLEPKSYIHHPQASEDDILQINRSTGTETIGLIAQEVYRVIPEAVRKPANSNEELWTMDYSKLIPVLINSVKELSEQNDELAQQNEELLQLYNELLKRIQALE